MKTRCFYTIRKSGALIIVTPAIGRMVVRRNSGRMRILNPGRDACLQFTQFPINPSTCAFLKELYGFEHIIT